MVVALSNYTPALCVLFVYIALHVHIVSVDHSSPERGGRSDGAGQSKACDPLRPSHALATWAQVFG